MKGQYQFTQSKDLENFSVLDEEISMDFHPRPGTVLPITAAEAKKLEAQWLTSHDMMRSAQSAALKKRNIFLDTTNKSLFLPVWPGTDLHKFNPEFTLD